MLALVLYRKLGVADDHEPLVQDLALMMGRSAGSVVRKLANFLAVETGRRKGLEHYAATDALVYREFEGRKSDLAVEQERILGAYRSKGARLISATKIGWGSNPPQNTSEMTDRLLSAARGHYELTGHIQHPELTEGQPLLFRFEGKLIGEAVFSGWDTTKANTIIFRLARPFPNQVLARNYLRGRNPYPTIERETYFQIRRDSKDLTGGTTAPIETGEAESRTVHRRGQDKVRRDALIRYGNQCCLCQIDSPALLVAGHIRGWARGEKSRGEPENVLLLCSLHDDLFGKGLMGLDPRTHSVIFASNILSATTLKQIRQVTRRFRAPSSNRPARKHLDWHIKHIFRGRKGIRHLS